MNYDTPNHAASRLGVHVQTLRRWAEAGLIAYVLTPGGHYRYAVDDYVERQSKPKVKKDSSQINGVEETSPEGEKSS